MNITIETLNERLKWTLDQKIDHSLFIIENALSYSNGNAYVSFSGGKDSTILLYLARLVKPDIKAVFFNTTNEFPEIYNFIKEIDCIKIQPEINLKAVIEKCGFPLISKEQSQYIREYRTTKSEKQRHLRLNGRIGKPYQGKISNKWQFLVNAKFDVSEKCCEFLKKRPARMFEKQNKLFPIIGTSVNESRLRLQKYLTTGCNAFNVGRPASYPLSIWTNEDKWNFIRREKIPYCDIYDKGETQTGCMICGFGCHLDNRFERLEQNYNKAFSIGMNYKNKGVTYETAIKTVLEKTKSGGLFFNIAL
jgi:3'-phosphoadenosine 5'-phosphosulfate sulfotransferase (PAPS reductase)/FAD synthetase